ncbi:MAG: VCBS repeat-containing protein [Planctomycetes bacterium]|nr:VCBS repeat-containing protein [Planctomycetota bacterium]
MLAAGAPLAAALCSGCYAGAAGLAALFVSLTDDGGGARRVDLAPQVTFVEAPARLEAQGGDRSPNRIALAFRVTNEDGGALSARVDVARVDDQGASLGDAEPAVPLPDSDPLTDIPSGAERVFRWDVRRNLGLDDASARVRFLVTPFEDGKPGEVVPSLTFRAGNTPVETRDLQISQNRETLTVNFALVDAEGDRVPVDEGHLRVELAIPGSGFQALPLSLLSSQRQDFSSAPAKEGGAQGSFSFEVGDLGGELEPLSQKGFLGDIELRILARDFTEEGFSTTDVARFRFDNNEPPALTPTAVPSGDLRSGVVPIRYSLADPDCHPEPGCDPERSRASLRVEVALDGGEPEAANELPSAASGGTVGLETDGRTHAFLWDALSQVRGDARVKVSLTACELEECVTTALPELNVSFSPLVLLEGSLEAGTSPSAAVSGDFDGDGLADVAVSNQVSGDVTFLRGGPSGLAPAAGSLKTGPSPVALAAGDFNGDGVLDLAVASKGLGSTGSIAVFLGSERGLEGPEQLATENEKPAALVSGDLDGDAVDDLVAASTGSDSLLHYRGGRAAGLSLLERVPVGAGGRREPVALVRGRFYEDAVLDVASANRASDSVTFLDGRPEGLTRIGEAPAGGDAPGLLAAGDFDGDGLDEVSAANRGRPSGVAFLDGGARDPAVSSVSSFPAGTVPTALARGDWNGDGLPDLAAAAVGPGAGALYPFAGGKQGVAALPALALGRQPSALASGDYDGDGFADLVAADGSSDSVSYLPGGPQGLREAFELLSSAGQGPVAIASGDFEGDGALDAAIVASGQPAKVTVLAGSSGGLRRLPAIRVGTGPSAMASADIDKDGFHDAVVANSGSDHVSLILGGPGGPREAGAIPISGSSLSGLTLGDFDDNGFPDLAVIHTDPRGLSLSLGSPVGLGKARQVVPFVGLFGFDPQALISGRFDRDSTLDLVAANDRASEVIYLRGGAQGLESTRSRAIPVGGAAGGSSHITVMIGADFDGDAALDLAAAKREDEAVTIVRGDLDPAGDGLAASGEDIPLGILVELMTSADFNGDGSPDLAAASSKARDLRYMPGGPGRPRADAENRSVPAGDDAAGTPPATSSPAAISSGDIDGDGFPDAVTANEVTRGGLRAAGEVRLLRGGPGGLAADGGPPAMVGVQPSALTIDDLDGDGELDVAVTGRGSGDISLLRWSGGRLTRWSTLPVGEGPAALGSGDYDGDGLSDLLAVNTGSSSVTPFLQRYLLRHPNRIVKAEGASPAALRFADPRSPPRFELVLEPGAFPGPIQVCVVPAPAFALPRDGVLSSDGAGTTAAYLLTVTGAVSVLREGTRLEVPARLTLRLRDGEPLLASLAGDPEGILRRLRVLCRDAASGSGVDVTPPGVEIVDLGTGKAVAFSIERFGTYLVALAVPR